MSDLIIPIPYSLVSLITDKVSGYKKGQHLTEQTWWGAESESIFEAPLSREDPWTVSVTQEGPPSTL